MCGIAGWIDFRDRSPNERLLRTMTRSLRRRGPDGEGYFEQGPVHLGHRRLSIIDIEGGAQPLSNEEGTIWIVFNGEIFNYRELREKLVAAGHIFKTESDTETIVHAYEEFGEECVTHLRGQFALAIWDQRRQSLFLARDRLGQKPLYYARTAQGLVFGSELKALLPHSAVSRELDQVAVDGFLAYRYIPEPRSIYRSVRKLPPAHTMLIREDGIELRRYWNVDFTPDSSLTENETLERLDALLDEATRLRMIADVPLGAFLSGGIDSSLVVGYMQRHSNRPIKTFSIGFEEDAYDERSYARQVAERYHTEHHEFVVRSDAIKTLPELVSAFDEPFADSSALAVFYLAEMTKEYVTVALNGDGGDESFAGYRRYRGAVLFKHYQRLPGWMKQANYHASNALEKVGLGSWGLLKQVRDWQEYASEDFGNVYDRCMAIPKHERQSIFSDDLKHSLRGEQGDGEYANALEDCSSEEPINQVMYADQRVYLPSDLLVKVDRMTMWHSLESRSPFLDHHLVEFAARIPPAVKFPNFKQKHLLKSLLRRDFPQSFVERKKAGFGVPVARWFRSDLKETMRECIEESQLVEDGLLSRTKLRTMFDEHLEVRRDRGKELWSVLCLEYWRRQNY